MAIRISEAGEKHYFTTLDDLMIFLCNELESIRSPPVQTGLDIQL